MRRRTLLLLVVALLLLLGPHKLTMPLGDYVGVEAQSGSFDGPTLEQQNALENLPATTNVGGRSAEPAGNSQWEWAKRAGRGGSAGGGGIAVDSSGNAYVTGYFVSTSVEFGSTTLNATNSSTRMSVFVAKLDSSGNWLWAKSVGASVGAHIAYVTGQGRGIAVDLSGNVYVTGDFFGSSAEFGSTTLNSSGSSAVFVAKLDSGGNWLWAKRAGGTSHSNRGGGIAVDSSGNAYVTGSFDGISAEFGSTTLNSSGSSAVFVAKLDSSGNWLWAKRAGPSGDTQTASSGGAGIAVDSSGNAYVTGSFRGTSADFGSTTLNSSGTIAVFVAKLDSSGNWLWAKRAGPSGDNGYSQARGIAVDSSGNGYVTGTFRGGPADFGFITLSSPTRSEVFVAKLDSSGNWLWAKRAGGFIDAVEGYGIAVDSSGNTYVTGSFRGGPADFGSANLSSSGSEDVFVAQLDSSGNWLWAKRAGASVDINSQTASSRGAGIAVDSSGNAYVTGYFRGTSADFGSTNLESPAKNNVFVAKFYSDGDGDGIGDSTDPCPESASNVCLAGALGLGEDERSWLAVLIWFVIPIMVILLGLRFYRVRGGSTRDL